MQEALKYLLGNPFVILAIPTCLLLALAYYRKIYPNAALVLAMLLPAALTAALLARNDIIPFVLAIDAAIIAIAVVDLVSLPRRKAFEAERSCQRVASIRKNHEVAIQLLHHGKGEYRVDVRDGFSQEFEATPSEFSIDVKPKSRATLRYQLSASRRGAFDIDQVHLRVRSRIGLWKRFIKVPCQSVIHVYPDMKQLAEYELLARTNRLSLLGVRRTRRVGQDNDFERLRDYTPDDNYKHIDWRSTARRNKLTVKDFQTSQSQRIIFMVDCGRMMTNESSGLSLLDHSLNAMLMLSYVALRRGDSVGLISFSDKIHGFVPAKGGQGQMNRLLHASFDRFPRLVESRYDDAFLHLSRHCRKRALVILLTNLIDEVNSNQVEQYLTTLVGRHLPLGVLIRDHRLFDAADQINPRGANLYRAAGAAEILNWRHQVLTDLQHKGVLSLDVFPEDMTAPLINQYLEIKARHLL